MQAVTFIAAFAAAFALRVLGDKELDDAMAVRV